MRDVPQSLLDFFAALPEGEPLKIVLNTKGDNQWKAEVSFYRLFKDAGPVTTQCDTPYSYASLDKNT